MEGSKIKYVLILALFFLITVVVNNLYGENIPQGSTPIENFYNLNAVSLSGDTLSMSDYKGKKILIVNVASKCGYTPQYKNLQNLYENYKDEIVVLGFPSNDFLWQEPGSSDEIATFCNVNYGVSFPMFQKVKVRGGKKHPIYKWLSEKSKNGWNDKGPSWNFCKYILDEEGELIGRFGSKTLPDSEDIIKLIEQALTDSVPQK